MLKLKQQIYTNEDCLTFKNNKREKSMQSQAWDRKVAAVRFYLDPYLN